jgi:hypothetical protein
LPKCLFLGLDAVAHRQELHDHIVMNEKHSNLAAKS